MKKKKQPAVNRARGVPALSLITIQANLLMEIMKAVLGLEDGQFVTGDGFGVEGECSGELVFNTLMSGYMEALVIPVTTVRF